jgi:hypothetical protein
MTTLWSIRVDRMLNRRHFFNDFVRLLPPRSARTALSFLLVAGTAGAQASVSGTVFDSLARQMLRGAAVQLVRMGVPGEPGYSTTSDSIGRFYLTGVRPGDYVLGFTHPRLDTLGFDPISRAVRVSPTSTALRIGLAIPSGATLALSICSEGGDSSGVVIGRVVDAERDMGIPGATVKLEWSETRISLTGASRAGRSARAVTDAEGKYVLCDLPLNTTFAIQATLAAPAPTAPADTSRKAVIASNRVDVTYLPGTPFLHRDLLISRPASTVASGATALRTGTARIAGRVLTPTGKPIPGARVTIRDARVADSAAVTDSSGAFRLSALPSGTFRLEAIKIGMTPMSAVVDLRAGSLSAPTITLAERVTTLETQKVSTTRPTDRNGFEDRRRRGNGYFLTAQQLLERSNRQVSDALIAVPGLRIAGTDQQGRTIIGGRGGCVPEIFLNGMRLPGDESLRDLDNTVPITQIAGIEVYPPGQQPGQFGRGVCTTVVMWTK